MAASNQENLNPGLFLGRSLGLFVIVFPATCMLAPAVQLPIRADHWVAWEVYAPRSSRALTVKIESLPDAASVTGQGEFTSLSELSLKTLGVPVYPQARFQAACLLEKHQFGKDSELRLRRSPILVSETAGRWSGNRKTVRLDSGMAVQRFSQKHWLNLKARRIKLPQNSQD